MIEDVSHVYLSGFLGVSLLSDMLILCTLAEIPWLFRVSSWKSVQIASSATECNVEL